MSRGHMVASGKSTKDSRFPEGTIKMQLPFFKECGLDFDEYFGGDFVCGTLNLSIDPQTVKIEKPEFFFREIKWTALFPAENFFMSKAEIVFNEKTYRALLYIPDPSTKPDHFQAPSIIEVIAQRIPDLEYDAEVTLRYNPEAISIHQ